MHKADIIKFAIFFYFFEKFFEICKLLFLPVALIILTAFENLTINRQ